MTPFGKYSEMTVYEPQPATAEEVWDFKGYANNTWHGVRVVAR